jgi:uncharacterized protein (TIGR03067 family)
VGASDCNSLPDNLEEISMRSKCLWFVVLASLAVSGKMQGADRIDGSEDVLKKIQGTWKFVSQEVDGKSRSKDELAKQTITFAGDKWTVRRDGKVVQAGTHQFDPAKKPGQVDAVVMEGEDKGATMLGVFELKEDTLHVCFDLKGKNRPTDFTNKAGRMTAVVERQKK